MTGLRALRDFSPRRQRQTRFWLFALGACRLLDSADIDVLLTDDTEVCPASLVALAHKDYDSDIGLASNQQAGSAMHESERLSALIGRIYDSTLDPNLWVEVLDEAARFVGGCASSLYYRDADGRHPVVAYQSGLDLQYVQLYIDTYARLDPTLTGYHYAKLEEPTATADIMLYDEFVQSRFYREWARPQRLVDSANAMLERSAKTAVGFVVFRHERDGLVDNNTRLRMRLIVPHMRRAALIGKTIDLKKAEAATLADTLDGISAAIFLVSATGRIVHANAAGHVMLNATDVLHAEAGRLAVNDRQADQVLADTFATAGNGDAAIGVKGVAVPLVARDGDRYVAHVLPLTSGARRRAGASYAAAAALFVHKAALDTPAPPEAIAKAYKLTPMELRVLLAVVEVGGVPEVAEAFGIAETTVRTHLHQTYQKTGTNRQAGLVKLVAAFSNPLVK
jgi:DNA-binding CsgD family transcriptional regulator